MGSKSVLIATLVFILIIIIISTMLLANEFFLERGADQIQSTQNLGLYNPKINPEDFTTKIDNKYMAYTPGTKFIYEGDTEDGRERTEVSVTDTVKRITGVRVLEVRDKVYLDGKLIEDTKDWYAQDKFGNVWYFGEESFELIDGKIASTEGSWVSGFYGAKPGIVMLANPKVGIIYRQEYFPGEAEDMGEVVASGIKVKVKHGSFTDCLQIKEINPFEPGDEEYKYYCPEAGGMVYEVGIKDGEGQQLIDVEKDSDKKKIEKKVKEEPREVLQKELTEDEAIEIAINEIDGKVTDVEIENKFGRPTYVVEMVDNGVETDVIIDIITGEILGIAT